MRREERRIALRERNAAHRLSSALVRDYDLLVAERLESPNMTRSARCTKEQAGRDVAQKRGLNREILERGWERLLVQLAYKAEWAGTGAAAGRPRIHQRGRAPLRRAQRRADDRAALPLRPLRSGGLITTRTPRSGRRRTCGARASG